MSFKFHVSLDKIFNTLTCIQGRFSRAISSTFEANVFRFFIWHSAERNERADIRIPLVKTLKFTDVRAKGSLTPRNRNSPISVTNYIIVVSFVSITRSRRINLFTETEKKDRKKRKIENDGVASFEAKDFYFYRYSVTRIPLAEEKIGERNIRLLSFDRCLFKSVYLKEWSCGMRVIVSLLVEKMHTRARNIVALLIRVWAIKLYSGTY